MLSSLVVVYGIALDYNLGDFGGPAPEFFLFFFALALLAANEGFQVREQTCLVEVTCTTFALMMESDGLVHFRLQCCTLNTSLQRKSDLKDILVPPMCMS